MKTVKVVRVVGGKREEIEIPAGQARELGISAVPSHPLSVAYLMDGLFVESESVTDTVETTCPHCGTTIRDVLLRHRVGCSHCYDHFASSVDRVLHIHRDPGAHADRIPARLQRYRQLFVEREALLHRLSLAVEQEDFEQAAGLRDEIRGLRGDELTSE